jgi:histidine triad (HIT) family protein
MKKCKFCEIINGNIPGQIVYRDDTVIALLDVHPRAKGHTLICPIQHHADMFDMPESTLRELMAVTKRLAQHYRETLGATGANILNASGVDAQQSVFHYHLHLLPRYPGDGIDAWPGMLEWKGDINEVLKVVKMKQNVEGTQQGGAPDNLTGAGDL